MFGTVNIKVRPLRLACLVEPKSEDQVREAIRLSSTLWGGSYFPIIPLHKRMPATWREKPLKAPHAREVILGYLDAFDPDILVQFSKDLPKFITDTGLRVIKPDEVWSSLDNGSLAPKFGIGLFEILNDLFEKHFRYTTKYPMKVLLPKVPQTLSLFWASWLGELLPKILSLLEDDYFNHLEIERPAFTLEKLADTMADNVLFPSRIAQYELRPHSRRRRFRGDANIFFLDAENLEDVIDFWNLRAIGSPVMPVPKQLQGSPQLRESVVEFLKHHRRHRPHNPKVCDFASFVRARSCTFEEMQGYAQTFKIDLEPGDPSDDPFFGLQHWYPRIWDEWAREKSGEAPNDIYGDAESEMEVQELQVRFRALLPAFSFNNEYHGEPRCANEIEFRLYGADQHLAEMFPKASGKNLAHAISGFGTFREWRIGRNGLVKLVEFGFTSSMSIPTAESIFFAWLKDQGWNPQLSPPGLLAKEIHKKLQGNPVALKNEAFLGLLERMNGGKVKRDINDSDVEQERELSVGEVKKWLKGTSEDPSLHDYLISRGVFKLGSKVQCPNCLRRSWFSLESLSDILTCPKCLNSFPAIGNVTAPDWSYKAVGPFSVPRYAEGAYTVLLTLEVIEGHKTLMRTTPVFSFKAQASDKREIEADVAMLWQESIGGETVNGLLFGECKSYGVFKEEDFERMRYLAETFPGAVLAFSTLRKSLNVGEIEAITRIAKVGRKYWKHERPTNPVLILTGTELLHKWSKPPRCWDDATQKRFGHLHGLLGICDATQQLYLSLPPWQNEWHEQREKKREKERQRREYLQKMLDSIE
jgi:hypothetical protein